MARNFFVLHKSGETFYAKNLHGDPVDQSLMVGFSSSVSNFCRTLLNEELREVVSVRGKIVYKTFGDFLFVVHCDLAVGATVIQAVLKDLGSLCEFLFGPCALWDREFFDLSGAHDIISFFLQKAATDPGVVVGGISQVQLPIDVRDRIDKLLSFLESADGVVGNSTALLLGDSVLYSRFTLPETRLILLYNKARPLGSTSIRFTPVYINGHWCNLYFVKIGGYTLTLMTNIDTDFASVQKRLEEFRMNFLVSRLEIPTEEPTLLLRLFAKRETLAMLYHNIKTGATLFPQLRPGPEVQQKEILNSFWNFFNDGGAALKIPGTTEFSIVKDAYRFYARSEGVHKLYILFANESVSGENVGIVANEILKNVKSFFTSH